MSLRDRLNAGAANVLSQLGRTATVYNYTQGTDAAGRPDYTEDAGTDTIGVVHSPESGEDVTTASGETYPVDVSLVLDGDGVTVRGVGEDGTRASEVVLDGVRYKVLYKLSRGSVVECQATTLD